MRFSFGKYALRSLQEDDLETIRLWRNQQVVKQYLIEQQEITEAEQLKWFKKIKHRKNLYFVIKEHETETGLIYASTH